MGLRICGALLLGLSLMVGAAAGQPATDEKDPLIGTIRLSELVKILKTDADPERRSMAAFSIAEGKAKAKSAIPALVEALKDKDRIVRTNVAMALAMMGPEAKAAVPALVETLKDKEEMVREQAARTLGVLGSEAKTAIPNLTAILKDTAQPARVREAAAHGLGRMGPDAKPAVPALTDALKDKNNRLRLAAASALFSLDKENAPTVVTVCREALKDTDETTQSIAVHTLKALGPAALAAVPDLMAALSKGGPAGYYAPEALGKIGPAAEAALVEAVKGKDENLRKAAAAVLKEYYPEAAKKAGLP